MPACHRLAAPVADEVGARGTGEAGRLPQLGRLAVADDPGQAEQVVEQGDAEGGRPLEQQVEQLGGGQRRRRGRGGWAGGRGRGGWRGCPACSRAPRRRAGAGRAARCRPADGRGASARSPPARRRGTRCRSAGCGPTSTAPPTNSSQARQDLRRSWAPGRSMAAVMPVSAVISGGTGRAGVDQRLQRAEALAAAVGDGPDLGDRVGGGRAAGRLEVDDAERDGVERLAEGVERCPRPRPYRTYVRAPRPISSSSGRVRRQPRPYGSSWGRRSRRLRCVSFPLPLLRLWQPDPLRRGHRPAHSLLPPLHRGW